MASADPTATDEALATQAGQGSVSAFEQLVLRYERRLFGFFLVRVQNRQTAEDLTQETFLRIFRHIRRFQPEHTFKTWIFTIAYRLTISHYRKGSAAGPEERERVDFRTPESLWMAEEMRKGIWTVVRESLTADQAAAVMLYYREEMSVRDIATSMAKSESNIKVLLHRARKQLAKVLGQSAGEESTLPATEALEI